MLEHGDAVRDSVPLGGGPAHGVDAIKADPHQVLDERFTERELADFGAAIELLALHAREGAANAGVVARDGRVDARPLGDLVDVARQRAVGEQVEETLDLGRRIRVRRLANGGTQVLEERGGPVEAEREAAELEARRLVRREDLHGGEVLVLPAVELHHLGQVDGRAVGARALLVDPADALLGEDGGGVDADVRAGEGLGVEAEHVSDLGELDARREGVEDLLAAAGLEAEVGLAALLAGGEDAEAVVLPGGQLVDADLLQHLGGVADEVHGGVGGVGRELLGELDDGTVVVGLDLAEGVGGVLEVLEDGAAVVAGDLRGEGQVALAHGAVDALDEGHAAVEVEAGVGPARLRQLDAEGEEGHAIAAFEAAEHLGGGGEAGGGQLVGVAGQLVEEEHEASGVADADGAEEVGAGVVELRGERGALPVALVEAAPEVGPLGEMVGSDVREGGGGAAQEGDGQRGRLLREVAGLAGELLIGVPGRGLKELGTGLEILGGGFPGAQADGHEVEPALRPGLELRGREARFKGAQAGLVGLQQGLGEPVETGAVTGYQATCDGHEAPPEASTREGRAGSSYS